MSTIQCTTCGKQYRFNEQIAGKQVRCQACGNTFSVPALAEEVEISLAPPESTELFSAAQNTPIPPVAHSRTRVSDEIDYEIFGREMQYCEITLDPMEQVIAEAGGMMYMSPYIQMETVFGDPSKKDQGFWGKVVSAGTRAMTGESLFMTTFTNHGQGRQKVAFAAPYPGTILPLHLDEMGGEIICQKDAFLCGARGIQISIAFQKKIGVALFGGEGFIMQRIQGDGIALVHGGGTMMHRDLQVGESLKLDTGCIMALAPSVNYEIEFVGGFKNTLFGGEGLFMATLTGPGKIWLQSLPFSRFAGRLMRSGSGGKDKGEGSLLGGMGDMLMKGFGD